MSKVLWVVLASMILVAGAPSGNGLHKEAINMSSQTPNIRFLNPKTLASPPGYTHVVETHGGRTVYIAGQVALNAEGELVGAGDIRAQAEQVFANLKLALEAVGGSFNNVVKLGVYVRDFSALPALREVRDSYINTERPPASTAVAVQRLFREEFLIEIDVVAVLPE